MLGTTRFTKNGRAADVGLLAAPPPPVSTTASVLTHDISITGNVSGGDLQVDGTIKGDVQVTRLLIGEAGHIQGAIHADVVEVRGHVAGSITAKQVHLHATAHLEGDLIHEQLTIEPGAFFEGLSKTVGRKGPSQPGATEVDTIVWTDPERS